MYTYNNMIITSIMNIHVDYCYNYAFIIFALLIPRIVHLHNIHRYSLLTSQLFIAVV